MARNNLRSLRRKDSRKRLMRAEPPAKPEQQIISRCARLARAKGLPTTITPEEVRGAA